MIHSDKSKIIDIMQIGFTIVLTVCLSALIIAGTIYRIHLMLY